MLGDVPRFAFHSDHDSHDSPSVRFIGFIILSTWGEQSIAALNKGLLKPGIAASRK
jgi:hypothetical protein